MQLERKNYPHLDAPAGPYVHAVKHNDLLFLSGLTAFNTPAQDADLIPQAKTVFDQLKHTLSEEGLSFESLIKVTIFVTEFGQLDPFRNVLLNAYQDSLPASSLIQVKGLFAPELKTNARAGKPFSRSCKTAAEPVRPAAAVTGIFGKADRILLAD